MKVEKGIVTINGRHYCEGQDLPSDEKPKKKKTIKEEIKENGSGLSTDKV